MSDTALLDGPDTCTSKGDGATMCFALTTSSISGSRQSIQLPHEGATAGARLHRLHASEEQALWLLAAPAARMRLSTLVESQDTAGSTLRPTVDRQDALWLLQNRRRGQLLLKRANEVLTSEEQRELATLQRTAKQRLLGVARRAMSGVGHYPLPPEGEPVVEPPPFAP